MVGKRRRKKKEAVATSQDFPLLSSLVYGSKMIFQFFNAHDETLENCEKPKVFFRLKKVMATTTGYLRDCVQHSG